MKNIFLVLIILFLITYAHAQISISEDEQVKELDQLYQSKFVDNWTWRTAALVERSEFHLGITSASRFGISENFELESHLFLSYLIPNIGMKYRLFYNKNSRWRYASRNVVYYPTPGLNFLRKTEFENIINKSAKTPIIIALKNEFIASYNLNPDCRIRGTESIITGRLGVDISYSSGDNTLPKLTYFTFYHRGNIIHNHILPYGGFQFDGRIEFINITASVDFFSVDFIKEMAIENLIQLHFYLSSKANFSIGVFTHFSNNEIEKDFNIFPHVDFIYKLNKKKSSLNLFNKKELRFIKRNKKTKR